MVLAFRPSFVSGMLLCKSGSCEQACKSWNGQYASQPLYQAFPAPPANAWDLGKPYAIAAYMGISA